MTEQAEQFVNAMNLIHGEHHGFRTVHAKGICATGTFRATPEAATISTAAHFQGDELPVTVRFSNGSGKPTRADGAKDERGMAVKFHVSDGVTTDIVCLTLPVFFVKTPEDFLEFLRAQEPDPATGKPDLDKVGKFVEQHPETQKALGFLMMTMSPASFANCTFHGIHAFVMTAPDGSKRFVRYRWVPDAEDAVLTDPETRALGKDYLHEEFTRRLASESMAWTLMFQLGEDEDDPLDPTVPWPEERTLVEAGRLVLTEATGDSCGPMIFDPGRVIDGVERSDDPILHARSDAYSVSFTRRSAQ